MPNRDWNHLLDIPAYPAERYSVMADRLAALMGTGNDVLLIQAEAVLALEAVATSLARPGLVVLNIVTSPYGAWFGGWLKRGGSTVHDLKAPPARPISIQAVSEALDRHPHIDVLALVHAESASGILNPLDKIVELAKKRGILTVVDAVASIGGHLLDVDRLGIDITVIGPQKALAGPAGLSAISVSDRAWEQLSHDTSHTGSMLSLIDQKHQWLETGRGVIPGTPAPLEFFALEAALDRLESEGMSNVITRHTQAAKATRAGLEALGATLWAQEQNASALVTTVVLPEGIKADKFLQNHTPNGSDLTVGVGDGAERLIRLNHTGQRANPRAVINNIEAYANALAVQGQDLNVDVARDAIGRIYWNRKP